MSLVPRRSPTALAPRAGRRDLLLLCCLCLAVSLTFAADDDDDDDDGAARRLIIRDGRPAVVLEPEQAALAITTAPLRRIPYRPEVLTDARVVDIRPLLEARRSYDELRNRARIRKVAARDVASRLALLDSMSDEAGLVSTREISVLKAEHHKLEAERLAFEAQQRSLREQVLNDWGASLVEEAFSSDSGLIYALIGRQAALIEVLIPPAFDEVPETVTVSRSADRGRPWSGELVTLAVRRGLGIRGQSAWYLVQGHGFIGTVRLYAWLAASGAAELAPVVPAQSLVWHAGRSWVYRREDDGAYVRVPVEVGASTANGQFITGAVKEGDAIVTHGAQVLLSEEFRWSIPDEDED